MSGTIITFYSYKGGVGRTFALANTAVTLCRWGYRVLCVDWDLEAPGLPFYFAPWLPNYAEARPDGLVGIVDRFSRGERVDPLDYALPVGLPDNRGRLDFLPAGPGGDRHIELVSALDWSEMYEQRGLGDFLEQCRTTWKAEYDLVLIDSRTGITDIGGICTVQMPEVLVMLFTASEQSMQGTLDVARRAVVANGLALRCSTSLLPAETWGATTPLTVLRQGHWQ